ncbi:MAG TPA: tetratricopeptide repeat protein [Flavobacteriales bacterium]|nr:tetratricopeptide repeat protein [Flavobacteriales bacterium]HIN40306.1 tetratricopeptide repeat protein [Flavobacteriales bacterium]
MLRLTLITSLCLWLSMASAVNLDSLRGVWNDKTQPDTNRLKAMHKIAKDYLYSQPDSAFHFAQLQHELAVTLGDMYWMADALNTQGSSFFIRGNHIQALDYYNKSLKSREQIGDKKGIARTHGNIGLIYWRQGNLEKALPYYLNNLQIQKEIGDKKGLAGSYNNIGAIYSSQGNNEQAIMYFKKSLKINKEISDKRGIGLAYGNIGLIYQTQGNYEQALIYYQKELKINKAISDKIGIGLAYTKIGGTFNSLGNYEQALEYYDESLKINEEVGYKSGIAFSSYNIGAIYSNQGNYEKALEYTDKSLKIHEELGDKNGIAGSYNSIGMMYYNQGNYEKALEYNDKSLKIYEETGNKTGMASSYRYIGVIYYEQGNFSETITLAKKGLALAQEVGVVAEIKLISALLYNVYKETGYPAKALEMHELAIEMRDSLNSVENKEAAIKLEYQHKYEKEQALAEAKHQEQMTLSAEREKRQQFIAWSAGGGLVMVLAFAFFILNRLQVTRRQKKVIEQQKELVEEQKKNITDSIQYAENIQRALLPDAQELSLIPDGFVLFQPKDIVSGDFYWMQHHNDRVYLAACDCTGHGVPGAFMSMIGSSLLDEAVVEKGITKPNEIFFEVRKGFINALKQTGETQKDGMDAVLIAWDKKYTLQLAAAYSPVIIIRKGEIQELKPDRQPVGFHTGAQKPFTHHEMKLEKGDTVYIFSDGYPDQFGGPKDKKFMMKNFKNLLLSIQDKTMNEQKTILEITLAEWKGDTEQVDDILVMGVRF